MKMPISFSFSTTSAQLVLFSRIPVTAAVTGSSGPTETKSARAMHSAIDFWMLRTAVA